MYVINGFLIDEKLWNGLKEKFIVCNECQDYGEYCSKCTHSIIGSKTKKLQHTYCDQCTNDEDCTNPFDCEDFKKNVKVIPGNVDNFIHDKISAKEYIKILEHKLKTFKIRNSEAGKLRNIEDWNKIFVEQLKG